MIKFVVHADPAAKEKTHYVGLALSEANLDRLIKKGDPIFVHRRELGVDLHSDILLVGGRSLGRIMARLEPLKAHVDPALAPLEHTVTRPSGEKERRDFREAGDIVIPITTINLLHVTQLYLTGQKSLMVIGVDDVARAKMATGHGLKVRLRMYDSVEKAGTDDVAWGFEVVLCSGKTEAGLESRFMSYGLIGKGTKWTKDAYPGDAAYRMWLDKVDDAAAENN